MGRTTKPLTIVIESPLDTWPEILALAEQGHTIIHRTQDNVDLILGPHAHRMNEDLRKYLPLALAEGRRLKYPKSTKETDGTPAS